MFRDEAMIRLPKILDFELRQRLLAEVDSKLLYYFLIKKLLTPLSERIFFEIEMLLDISLQNSRIIKPRNFTNPAHLLAVHLKVEI